MVVHTYNPSTQKLRQEDCEFEYSYIVKVCKKERKRKKERKEGRKRERERKKERERQRERK
jgi:hypothetical protein